MNLEVAGVAKDLGKQIQSTLPVLCNGTRLIRQGHFEIIYSSKEAGL